MNDDTKRRVVEIREKATRDRRVAYCAEHIDTLGAALDSETKRADEAERGERHYRASLDEAIDAVGEDGDPNNPGESLSQAIVSIRSQRDAAIKRALAAEEWQTKVIADRDAVALHMVRRAEEVRDAAIKRADEVEARLDESERMRLALQTEAEMEIGADLDSILRQMMRERDEARAELKSATGVLERAIGRRDRLHDEVAETQRILELSSDALRATMAAIHGLGVELLGPREWSEDGPKVTPRYTLHDVRAEIERLHNSYVPHSVASECLERLQMAGFDVIGKPNTLWAMVHAACSEVERLRIEATAYRGALLAAWPENDVERLVTEIEGKWLERDAARKGDAR